MAIPGGTDRVNNLVCLFDGQRKLLAQNFQPRDVVVMSNSEPAKSKLAHRALGTRHLS